METPDPQIESFENKYQDLRNKDPFGGDEDFFRQLPEKIVARAWKRKSAPRFGFFQATALTATVAAVAVLILYFSQEPVPRDTVTPAEVAEAAVLNVDVSFIEESIIREVILETYPATVPEPIVPEEHAGPEAASSLSPDTLASEITLEEIIQYLSNKDLSEF